MICHPPLLLSVLVPYYLPALHLLTGPFFLFLFLVLFLPRRNRGQYRTPPQYG